jgi:hypothetical protein
MASLPTTQLDLSSSADADAVRDALARARRAYYEEPAATPSTATISSPGSRRARLVYDPPRERISGLRAQGQALV